MLHEATVRYIAAHGLIGKAVGWGIGIAVIAVDVAGLGTLLRSTDFALIGGFMICFIFGTTLGSLQMGLAVQALSEQPGWMPVWLRAMMLRLRPSGA